MNDSGRLLLRIAPIVIAVVIAIMKYSGSEKGVNELGRQTRYGLTPEDEATLGLKGYQEVLQKYRGRIVQPGDPRYARDLETVQRVAARLEQAVTKSGQKYDWKVSLVDSQEVNAFCLPGGKIVVYTGILPVTRDKFGKEDAGLATVLGHEISHATLRHGSERVAREQATNIVLQGVQVSMLGSDPSRQQQVMSVLGATADLGLLKPWGRAQESEADHQGLTYMAMAGYDPAEAVEFWKRMQSQGGGKKPPEWLSTHPSDETRVGDLKKWLPAAEQTYQQAHAAGIGSN